MSTCGTTLRKHNYQGTKVIQSNLNSFLSSKGRLTRFDSKMAIPKQAIKKTNTASHQTRKHLPRQVSNTKILFAP